MGLQILSGLYSDARSEQRTLTAQFCNNDGLSSKIEIIYKYHKVARSTLSKLVAHLRIFRLLMKGKFDAYVLCVTFGQKSSKLNSRPVYCSQLYGKCRTLGYNTISNEGNLKETLIKIVLLRNSYCPKQYCAGFKCIKESEIKSKKTTNVRWCNLLVCLHSTSWYTIV